MCRLFLLTIIVFTPILASALTLNQAFHKAIENNPTLLSAQADLKIAKENLIQAKADFWPTIDADASISDLNTEVSNGSDTDYQPKTVGLSISQPIYKGGQITAEKKAKKAAFQAQEADYKNSVQTILLEVVDAYLSILREKKIVELQENQLSVLAEQYKSVEKEFEAGEANKTDLSQAEARLAGAKANVTSAIGDLIIARSKLQQLIGDVASVKMSWPEQEVKFSESLEDIKLKSATKHPQILAEQANLESAKFDLKEAKGTRFPTLSATADIDRNWDTLASGSETDTTSRNIALSFSLPLSRGGKLTSQVREALQNVKKAEQSLESTKRSIENEAINAHQSYKVAKANYDSFKKSEFANLIAVEGVQKERQLGERTVLEELDARQELLEARVNVIRARRDKIYAAHRLRAAIGELEINKPLQPKSDQIQEQK